MSGLWDRRAASWDHSAMPGLGKIADEVVRRAGSVTDRDVVDLGCGSGQLALRLAATARSMVAVDLSRAMLERLEKQADDAGLTNVETILAALQTLELPAGSVDVIVSNYAFHHLRDPQKAEVLKRAARWLRPGGVVVIGDMMFSIRAGSADREIISSKVLNMARKGPAGWWRITKNAWRFVVARKECPAPIATWETMFRDAGFTVTSAERIVAEGGVVSGRLLAP